MRGGSATLLVASAHALAAGDLVKPSSLSTFVTQRAVQSQMYYLALNRDRFTAIYLSGFCRDSPLPFDYHGVDGLGTATSRDFVCALLDDDERQVVVKKPINHRGGVNSRTGEPIDRSRNPYLETKYIEYTIDLQPPVLAERVMDTRAQIAAELRVDLGRFKLNDADLARRRTKGLYDDDGECEGAAEARQALKHSPPAFDDSAEPSGRSSPLRAATYDLVRQLATAHAVEALLKRPPTPETPMLRQLWDEFKPKMTGSRTWLRGVNDALSPQDDLVLRLAAMPPAFQGDQLLDPSALADAVVAERAKIAARWTKQLDKVHDENRNWRNWHLSNIIERPLSAAQLAHIRADELV